MVIQAYLFLEKKLKRKKSKEPAVTGLESKSQPETPQLPIPSTRSSKIIQSNSSLQSFLKQATEFPQKNTLAPSSLNISRNKAQIKNPTSSKGW